MFVEEWVYLVELDMFAHAELPGFVFWKEKDFNKYIRQFSDVDNTARLLIRNPANQGYTAKYDPGASPGLFHDDEAMGKATCFQHLRALHDQGLQPGRRGAKLGKDYAKPFEDFLVKLIPVEQDRFTVSKWSATLMAKGGTKMHFGCS